MKNNELNKLIEQVQCGDETAFSVLYQQMHKGIFSFIYSIVCNYQDAEDLTQETFIKIRRYIQSYKIGTNASAWILQIAKNLSLDFIKSKKQYADVKIDDIPNTKQSLIEDKMFLHDMMAKILDIEERQIIVLHIVHGYKNREIARFLDLPLGTVLWKYNVAMKKLHKELKEVLDEKK